MSVAKSLLLTFLLIACCCGNCQGWLIPNWWTPCYSEPPIGCFSSNYPFNNSGGFYPHSPDDMNIRFHLHSRRRNDSVTLANVRQKLSVDYDFNLKTVFIIHGYQEEPDEMWIVQMIAEILSQDDKNVIVVNWSEGANSFFYFQSVANARVVGAVLSLLIQELMSMGSQASNVHLIGFSLGAHVAGYAGSRLGGIGRITGLDPAGPSFEDTPPEVRLDPTDALFVDVIHTDSSPGLGMGTLEPMGMVDFYVNGGRDQPSCANSVIGRVSAFFETLGLGFDSMRSAVGCSHLRATQLYITSIRNSCSWETLECPSHMALHPDVCAPCEEDQCHMMGYNIVPQTSGQHERYFYRTDTPHQSPFC